MLYSRHGKEAVKLALQKSEPQKQSSSLCGEKDEVRGGSVVIRKAFSLKPSVSPRLNRESCGAAKSAREECRNRGEQQPIETVR